MGGGRWKRLVTEWADCCIPTLHPLPLLNGHTNSQTWDDSELAVDSAACPHMSVHQAFLSPSYLNVSIHVKQEIPFLIWYDSPRYFTNIPSCPVQERVCTGKHKTSWCVFVKCWDRWESLSTAVSSPWVTAKECDQLDDQIVSTELAGCQEWVCVCVHCCNPIGQVKCIKHMVLWLTLPFLFTPCLPPQTLNQTQYTHT